MEPIKVVNYVNDFGEIRVRIEQWDDSEGTYVNIYGDLYNLTIHKPSQAERIRNITWEDKIRRAIAKLNKQCEELTKEYYIKLTKIKNAEETLKKAIDRN
jgi:hypothetical protein